MNINDAVCFRSAAQRRRTIVGYRPVYQRTGGRASVIHDIDYHRLQCVAARISNGQTENISVRVARRAAADLKVVSACI